MGDEVKDQVVELLNQPKTPTLTSTLMKKAKRAAVDLGGDEVDQDGDGDDEPDGERKPEPKKEEPAAPSVEDQVAELKQRNLQLGEYSRQSDPFREKGRGRPGAGRRRQAGRT